MCLDSGSPAGRTVLCDVWTERAVEVVMCWTPAQPPCPSTLQRAAVPGCRELLWGRQRQWRHKCGEALGSEATALRRPCRWSCVR